MQGVWFDGQWRTVGVPDAREVGHEEDAADHAAQEPMERRGWQRRRRRVVVCARVLEQGCEELGELRHVEVRTSDVDAVHGVQELLRARATQRP